MEKNMDSINASLLSIIVPVYNRPDEVDELLESLVLQENPGDFEVIIIEDGSKVSSQEIVKKYATKLHLKYKYTPNGGPSKARNIGADEAEGAYLLILDSDVVLPPFYLSKVREGLLHNYSGGLDDSPIDCFGGPDAAAPAFSDIQKAINYAMTAFFTTGGIRGGKGKKLDKFHPRSFNLGVKRKLFAEVGGFDTSMRFGEDIDFSLRLRKKGCHIVLLPEAYVFHKRRVDFKKFFRQVFNSGQARIDLQMRHPRSMKLVHLLPGLFLIYSILALLCTIAYPYSIILLLIPALCFFLDSLRLGNKPKVAFLSILAAYTQLWGYGLGFWTAWTRALLGKKRSRHFDKTFYD